MSSKNTTNILKKIDEIVNYYMNEGKNLPKENGNNANFNTAVEELRIFINKKIRNIDSIRKKIMNPEIELNEIKNIEQNIADALTEIDNFKNIPEYQTYSKLKDFGVGASDENIYQVESLERGLLKKEKKEDEDDNKGDLGVFWNTRTSEKKFLKNFDASSLNNSKLSEVIKSLTNFEIAHHEKNHKKLSENMTLSQKRDIFKTKYGTIKFQEVSSFPIVGKNDYYNDFMLYFRENKQDKNYFEKYLETVSNGSLFSIKKGFTSGNFDQGYSVLNKELSNNNINLTVKDDFDGFTLSSTFKIPDMEEFLKNENYSEFFMESNILKNLRKLFETFCTYKNNKGKRSIFESTYLETEDSVFNYPLALDCFIFILISFSIWSENEENLEFSDFEKKYNKDEMMGFLDIAKKLDSYYEEPIKKVLEFVNNG